MDVELPNGYVVQGVPDGTPKHAIAMKAIRAGLAKNSDFGYDDSDAAIEGSFIEGVGAGMTNVGRQVGNIVGLVDDETLEEQKNLDRHMTFGKGGGGKFVGEMVATAPVGMGVGGAVAKGANALRLASRPGKALASTLQRGAGRAAVEGATYGGVLAGPDDRGTGAVVGAAAGSLLSGAGEVLGKAIGKGQFIKLKKEATRTQMMTGQFIPLSQSAEAGLGRMIYNALLSNMTGVGGKIRGQYKTALNDFRRFVGEHAHPEKALVDIKPTDSIGQMMGKLKNYWDTAFDEIKTWPIKAFGDVTPMAPKWLVKKITKESEGTVKALISGSEVTGAEILSLNTVLGTIISTMGNSPAKAQAIAYQKSLRELLKRNLNPSGKGTGAAARVLHEYEEAVRYYPAWQSVQKAAAAADDKIKFSPTQHLAKADRGKTVSSPYDRAPGERVSQLAVESLKDFPSRQGLFQQLAAGAPTYGAAAGVGAAAGGPVGAAVGVGIVYALARIGASKGLQKYLSRQTTGQKLNRALMQKYKKELIRLGATARQAMVILGEQDGT